MPTESAAPELSADPAIRLARRRTLIAAVAQLVVAVVAFWAAMRLRHPRPDGHGYYVVFPGGLYVLIAMILFGVSLALLLRSPFRRSVGERAFRVIWLGPLGRAFVRLSGRRAWRRQAPPQSVRSGVSRETARVPMPSRAVTAPDRIEALEQRVSELERWRQEAR